MSMSRRCKTPVVPAACESMSYQPTSAMTENQPRRSVVFDFPILLSDSAADSTPPNKHRYLTQGWYQYHTSSESPNISEVAEAAVKDVRRNAEYLKIRSDGVIKVRMYQLHNALRPASTAHKNWEMVCQDIDEAYLLAHATYYPLHIGLDNVQKPQDLVAVLFISAPSRSSPPLYTLEEVNEVNAQIRRENIAAAARGLDSPSAGATAARRTQTQKDYRKGAVYNYRPVELAPPPITIYHPVFAKFIQMMSDRHAFTHDELDRAQKFITQTLAYCPTEAARLSHSSEMKNAVHANILSSMALSFASSKLLPDGAVSSGEAPNGFIALSAICEAKVEIGEGGCDPLAQAECAYVAVYASAEAQFVRAASCCPAFLVGMAGPNIIVSGAVFADQFIAQTLTDYISIIPRLGDNGRSPFDSAGHRVATLFRALKTCITDLNSYYSRLMDAIAPPQPPKVASTTGGGPSFRMPAVPYCPPSMISPHFTTYHHPAYHHPAGQVVLTYKKRLAPSADMKAVFVAEAKSASETATVVVKFTHKYNREAHDLLARASPPQAPLLRYCAYEPTVQLWVVVMDYVKGTQVKDKLTNPAHIASLQKAVTTLHSSGFVFGDLRAPNVLTVGDVVVLIDFDWSGKYGEARYPSDILLGDSRINWHPTVHRGGPMMMEHDAHFFHALTGKKLL